jgi:hypothetical protein
MHAQKTLPPLSLAIRECNSSVVTEGGSSPAASKLARPNSANTGLFYADGDHIGTSGLWKVIESMQVGVWELHLRTHTFRRNSTTFKLFGLPAVDSHPQTMDPNMVSNPFIGTRAHPCLCCITLSRIAQQMWSLAYAQFGPALF